MADNNAPTSRSLIDRVCEKLDLPLFRDVPEDPKRRNTRDWAKLIGLARKLENEDQAKQEEMRDRFLAMSEKLADAKDENARLHDENKKLTARFTKSVYETRAHEIDLSNEARKQLLAPVN